MPSINRVTNYEKLLQAEGGMEGILEKGEMIWAWQALDKQIERG